MNEETREQESLQQYELCDHYARPSEIKTRRCAECQDKADESWKFWKELVCTDGEIDAEKIKDELHDYGMLLDLANEVYYHISDGRLSKPFTDPGHVIQEFDDKIAAATKESAAALAAAQQEIERLEKSVEKEIENRDGFEERINQIGAILCPDAEWSNFCDVGEECVEAATQITAEIERLKAALSAAPAQPTAPKTEHLQELLLECAGAIHSGQTEVQRQTLYGKICDALGSGSPQETVEQVRNATARLRNWTSGAPAERDFEAEASRVWDEKWGEGYKYVWVNPDDGKCVFSTQAPDACQDHQYVNTLAAKDMIKDSMRLHGHTYDTD